MTGETLLEIEGLRLEASVGALVDGIDLRVGRREMVGLVGESGCGKTVTALSILRLLPDHAVLATAGAIRFCGEDLLQADEQQMQAIRGNRISMIFQEPMTSLNPVMTVGDQIAEVLSIHRGLKGRAARERVAELLKLVGLPADEAAAQRYPFQMSGGQRQRVMIAIALACEPELLIADEPTTALDVTVQAQILDLIKRMQDEFGMGCILVTHDLGVVADLCDRAVVMYAGRVAESGPVGALFSRPLHRYTRALLDTIPASNPPGARLPAIGGMVPAPGDRPPGCAFVDRCPAALAQCRNEPPPLVEREGQVAYCWNPAS